VDPLAVRDALIAIFARWGLPKAIKVDNGEPFGDPYRKSIPALALWLISLDIAMIWNRPRQPTDNAIVERMQGTSKRWADVDRCANYAELSSRLADVALIQREQYEVSRLGYKTRLQTYPGLEQVTPIDAREQFDARRAYAYLAQTRLVRRTSKNGRVSLYGYGYQVGYAYRKQEVGVGFDPDECAWVFYDQLDQPIGRVPAQALTPEHIWSLSVTQRTL
jgi:putative transposase